MMYAADYETETLSDKALEALDKAIETVASINYDMLISQRDYVASKEESCELWESTYNWAIESWYESGDQDILEEWNESGNQHYRDLYEATDDETYLVKYEQSKSAKLLQEFTATAEKWYLNYARQVAEAAAISVERLHDAIAKLNQYESETLGY